MGSLDVSAIAFPILDDSQVSILSQFGSSLFA